MADKYLEMYRVPDPTGRIKVGYFLYLQSNGFTVTECANKLNLGPGSYDLLKRYHKLTKGRFRFRNNGTAYMNTCEELLPVKVDAAPPSPVDTAPTTRYNDCKISMRAANRRTYDAMAVYRRKVATLKADKAELNAALKAKNRQLFLTKRRLQYSLNAIPRKVCCRVDCDVHTLKTLDNDIINNYIDETTIIDNIHDTTIIDNINDTTIIDNIDDTTINNNISSVIDSVVDCNKSVSDIVDCNNRTKVLKVSVKNLELIAVKNFDLISELKSKKNQLRLMKQRLRYSMKRTPKKVCCRVNCDIHAIRSIDNDITKDNNINDFIIIDNINDTTINDNINDTTIIDNINTAII